MRRCDTGFAYVWVLAAVALMGVALVASADVYLTSVRREQERELLFVGHQFRAAIGRYRETRLAGGRQEYPATLDDLLLDKRYPDLRRHLRRINRDPMTGSTQWGLVQLGGRIVGVHSLSNAKPIKIDGFDVDDASFRGKGKYSEWVFTYPADLLLRPESPVGSVEGLAGGPAPPPTPTPSDQSANPGFRP